MENNNIILQWNLNGYFNNVTELQLLISKYQPKTILLQETHLLPEKTVKQANYKIMIISKEEKPQEE